jgi:hypothetical protein
MPVEERSAANFRAEKANGRGADPRGQSQDFTTMKPELWALLAFLIAAIYAACVFWNIRTMR